MTTANTTPSSEVTSCPFCGKPYKTVVIPALFGMPERIVLSKRCGCAGELESERELLYREKVRERESILRSTGIPKRYWEVPEDTTYMDAISQGGVFFYGNVGRGKTYSAVGLLKAWMNRNRGKRAVFADSNAIFSRIRQTYDTGESERDAMWRFIGCDLLLYDDFGKGRPGEWSLSKVEDIVNERYNELRPTIFTSQWVGGELVSRLAEGGSEESALAVVSRINGMCQLVKMDGPDRRLQ